MSDIIDYIQRTAQTDPVEAATLFVKSTATPDPTDPFKLPWSVEASLIAYKKIVGPLTPEQERKVLIAGWETR